MKHRQSTREPVIRNGLDGGNLEMTNGNAAKFPQHTLCSFGTVNDPGLRLKKLSCFRKLDGSTNTVKQHNLVLVF